MLDYLIIDKKIKNWNISLIAEHTVIWREGIKGVDFNAIPTFNIYYLSNNGEPNMRHVVQVTIAWLVFSLEFEMVKEE